MRCHHVSPQIEAGQFKWCAGGKAFDSVNHDLLINKLHFCGIRGNALNLIKTFISVDVNRLDLMDYLVMKIQITFKFLVLQDTVLSPVSFIIYNYVFLNLNLVADNTLLC